MSVSRLVSALHTWVLPSAAIGMVVGIIDRTTIPLSHKLLVSLIPPARHEYGASLTYAPLNHQSPGSLVTMITSPLCYPRIHLRQPASSLGWYSSSTIFSSSASRRRAALHCSSRRRVLVARGVAGLFLDASSSRNPATRRTVAGSLNSACLREPWLLAIGTHRAMSPYSPHSVSPTPPRE
ncbi:hypothetical protein BDV93DRAFT_188974 [Ceratobasidium sp. AG-I]|nr:hypothetical protein BDV93DRAFT_188974 [Ceratobasidium sp. AG-I]